jgi:cytochrome c553
MHMAKVVGCWAGCHGKEGEGGDQYVDELHAQVAPTLSHELQHYSDAELARLVRYGVRRDGRSAVGMISDTFWSLSDQDLVDIIAFLRRQPLRPPVERRLELTLRGRIAMATGEWKPSADRVDPSAPRWGELPRTVPVERGRYLASVTCSECHGADFKGNRFEGGPSLAILAMYGFEDFRHLMRTGRPIGGRKI